jgi:membrane associated rhomboid family serine protease
MVAQATIGILLATVFTLPSIHEALAFRPALAFHRPWTFLTYLLVFSGLPGLGVNLLLLWLLGPSVEQRMGGRSFLLYYLLAGFLSAWLALGLTSFMAVPPLLGSGGAVLGVAFAFAVLWPDAYLNLQPLPYRPRVRTLITGLVMLVVVLAIMMPEGNAHLAQLGGVIAGYAFFRIRMMRAPKPEVPPAPLLARPVRTAVTVPHGAAEPSRPVRPQETPRERYSSEELDRVLDKISASGLASLTPEERRFLDQMSARRRKDAG